MSEDVETASAEQAAGDVAHDDAETHDLVEVEDPRSREELLEELAVAERQRDEYLDDLRRARADFENYRRRMMREGVEQRESGRADLASSLVEVLDDLDRTLEAAMASSDDQVSRGIELVAEKLHKTLADEGLTRIDAVGVPFDPNRHEAVQHRPADADGTEPTVVEVLRPGYVWGEKMLRAAMVVVEG